MDRPVRWDAIWAGVMLALCLMVGMTALALATHVLALTPEGKGIPFGRPNSALITGALGIIALFWGGWAAGRLAHANPAVHGLLAGASTLIVSLLSGALGVSGLTAMLMGPFNLHNFTQRALQGLAAPAEVSAGAAQLSGWYIALMVLGLLAASWGGQLASRSAHERLAPRA